MVKVKVFMVPVGQSIVFAVKNTDLMRFTGLNIVFTTKNSVLRTIPLRNA